MKAYHHTVTDHGTCAHTGKLMFNCAGAKEVATGMRRRKDSNHAEYHCPRCGWWHVGSTIQRRRRTARPERWRAHSHHRHSEAAA